MYTVVTIGFSFPFILFMFDIKTKEETTLIYMEFGLFYNVLFTLRYCNIALTTFARPMHEVLFSECEFWDNVWIAPWYQLLGTHNSCHDFFFRFVAVTFSERHF